MLIHWLHKTISFSAKPFVEAESVKEYSTRGYWIFGGIIVVIVILFLIISGYIGGIASQSPASLLPYLEPILKKVGLDGLPKTIPLSILIIILYITIGLIPLTRTFIGEILCYVFYHLMNLFITGGEWCIEHRGGSTVLVIILISVFIWGIKGVIEKSRRETLLTTTFNVWLQGAERFVVQDTFTSIHNGKIKDVNERWQKDLEEVLEIRGGYTHPATFLHQAIDLLPTQPLPTSQLDGFAEECKQKCRPVEQMSDTERRARDLLYILMGKIYNRIASGDKDISRKALDYKKSFDYFDSVDLRHYKDDKAPDHPYLFAVNNGKGTVYAGVYTILAGNPNMQFDFCPRDYQCALKAFEVYDAAAKNAQQLCSYERRRRANNLTDLLTRLGLDYKNIVNKNWTLKERAKMEKKETLADEIELNIKQMLSCNKEGELNPDFVTIAQAYSTCALLKASDSSEEARLLQASGMYLRLEYSYEPDNLSEWELKPFCSTIRDNKFVSAFKDAICLSGFNGLTSLDLNIFKEAIGEQCDLSDEEKKVLKEANEAPCGSTIFQTP